VNIRAFRWIALLLAMILTSSPQPVWSQPARETLEIGAAWRFHKGGALSDIAVMPSSDWTRVDLPNAYNAKDGDDGGGYYRGAAWYRRTLSFTPSPTFARTYIEFDGAAVVTDLWVNGAHVGQHRGGYARFRFDLTPYLHRGNNTLLVKTDNGASLEVAPLGGDFTVFGGIYRQVRLVRTRDLHLDMLDYGSSGVEIRQSDVSRRKADLAYRVRVANDGTKARAVLVRVRLKAEDRTVLELHKRILAQPGAVAVADLSGALLSPHLWDGVADPYLYASEVSLEDAATGAVLDQAEIRTGIRSVVLTPDRGVMLNGHPYGVHGVNIHQSMRPGRGPAVGEAEIDADFRMLQELGVTGLRFAHYQHPQRDYDLADQDGVLVWTEVPFVAKAVADTAFGDNLQDQLRELIRQNINHPSVFVWGLGNEIYNVDAASAHWLERLQAVAHAEDPDRPTTYANCCAPIDGPQASHTDAVGSNVYYGWYDGQFDDLGPWLDANHAKRPATPEAISEYGAGGSPFHQEDPPKRPRPDSHWHPEQYQALYHERAWTQIAQRGWLWASFVWCGFDFPSDGRNEGDHAGINDKGLITYDRRIKKDAYFWYQANWSRTPMLYITSRRDVVRRTPDVVVKVYGNVAQARLSLNDADLGAQTFENHMASWRVRLRPGKNHLSIQSGATQDSVTWVLAAPRDDQGE
jgi:beta-galactosidase